MALNSITYNGLTYLAGLVASGSALKISRVAVGTGILPTGYNPAAMTDLIAFKQDADISGKSHEGTTAIISAQVTPASGDDFAVTEVGIYATDDEDKEILYAYADLSDHPQPIYSDTSGGNSGTTINTKIFVSSVSQIIADISPVALVTRRVFDLYIGTPDDYSNQKAYAEGAYCVRNNSLYRCKSAISVAEEWTESHWEAITILGEIGSLMYPEFDDSGTAEEITDYSAFYNSIKTKMSIFDFFKNLKTGLNFLLNVAQLVNNSATNNPNMPAGAQGLYKLGQEISKLNAEILNLPYFTINYTPESKSEALNLLDNPKLITGMLQEKTSPYMIIFVDTVGDSPITGGTSLILGYEYTDGSHGSQLLIKYNKLQKRDKIEKSWSGWVDIK